MRHGVIRTIGVAMAAARHVTSATAAPRLQSGSTPRPAIARIATPVDNAVDDAGLERIEQAALASVNAERAAAGLPPLECTPELCRIARTYSRDMVERHYFSHQ